MFTEVIQKSNSLLAVLPPAEWERWLPHLEAVPFGLGQVTHTIGSPRQIQMSLQLIY